MAKELVQHEQSLLEKVVIGGDISKLNPDERLGYYNKVCESLGLNPFTRPFEYMTLQGKMTLYARKDATEQLRKIHGISITKIESKMVEGVYIVTAYARKKDGQEDVATGAVNVAGLKGDMFANALMKAETKAKRRVTLSLGGLGMLDETEVETIPAERVLNETPHRLEVIPLSENARESILTVINDSQTLDELKTVFADSKKISKDDPEFLKEIVIAKDKRKAEIEKKGREEFVDELDQHL